MRFGEGLHAFVQALKKYTYIFEWTTAYPDVRFRLFDTFSWKCSPLQCTLFHPFENACIFLRSLNESVQVFAKAYLASSGLHTKDTIIGSQTANAKIDEMTGIVVIVNAYADLFVVKSNREYYRPIHSYLQSVYESKNIQH